MYTPHIAVVTNVEADHLDNYGGFEMVKENFARFVDRVEPGGTLVAAPTTRSRWSSPIWRGRAGSPSAPTGRRRAPTCG